MTDNRGAEILEGRECAFNLSGEIAKGVVLSASSTPYPTVYNPLGRRFRIKVELLHGAAGHQAGHISTLRSPKNLLMLRPEDGAAS